MMRLTRKQRAWLEEYLRSWNATEAARRAGYATPRQAGAKLVSKAVIQESIQTRLAEMKMSTDEVLTRLAQQARAEYADYLQPDGTVDLALMLADGKGHLVKGTKWDNRSGKLTVEFYDAQAALVHLGKHLGIFKETQELDIGHTMAELLERVLATRGSSND